MKYLLGIVICFFSINCYAVHIAGGEITYTYLTSRVDANGVQLHTYKLVFNWYETQTCTAGSDIVQNNLGNIGRTVGDPTWAVIQSPNFYEFIKMENINNLSEVVDLRNVLVLESVVGLPENCACNGPNSIAGISKFTFTGNVEVPERVWRIKVKDLQRSANDATGSTPPFYIETILNNQIAPHNSSVQFANSAIVVPVQNQNFTYNHGAYDPDGDILEYEFIIPMTTPHAAEFPVSAVSYNFSNNYSVYNILGGSSGTSYNNTLGNGSFSGLSSILQKTILAVRITEKNSSGVVVGSVIRDMMIKVIPGNNTNPNLSDIIIDNTNTNSTQVVATAGTQLCFDVEGSDVDIDQKLTLFSNDLGFVIPTATFNVAGDNSPNPIGSLCWSPTLADAGKTFCFTITAKDNACSSILGLPDGVTIKSYCITVVPPTCPPNLTCETIIEICQDVHLSSTCECSSGKRLWYQFNVTNPSQQINISGSLFNSNGNSSNLSFQYAIIKPFSQDYDCTKISQEDIINSGTTNNLNYSFNASNAGVGTYLLAIDPKCDRNLTYELDISFSPKLNCIPCEDCIGSFRPIPDQKYIISAWAKEAGAPLTKTSYDKPIIKMHFYDAAHNALPSIADFKASGMIIDGWQRIEEEFFVPAPTAYVAIELVADGVDVFFDDIRVFPFDASMKSYVYDPVNMRLVAELDERHYATFYEYDEEGKLIRIKKETEKGVMTIQETRNSTKKQ